MMTKRQTTRLFGGLFLALALSAQGLAQSPGSRPSDGCENTESKAQPDSFDDFEILPRAEKRAEKMRDQLLDLQIQETSLQSRLEDLDFRLTPESIQTAMMFIPSALLPN
jgi:hypothetical protein